MKLNILVIGRNLDILETVVRLINGQQDWKANGVQTDDEALKIFGPNIDLVLFGGGVEESSEQELTSAFRKINPSVKISRHYGGGSGLLFNEILEAMIKQ